MTAMYCFLANFSEQCNYLDKKGYFRIRFGKVLMCYNIIKA